MLSIILLILQIVISLFIGIIITIPVIALILYIQKRKIKKNIHKLIERGEFKFNDRTEYNNESTRQNRENNTREPVFEGKRTVNELERDIERQRPISDVHDSDVREPVQHDDNIKRELDNVDRQSTDRVKLHKPTII